MMKEGTHCEGAHWHQPAGVRGSVGRLLQVQQTLPGQNLTQSRSRKCMKNKQREELAHRTFLT